jgi:cell division protein ZapA
MPQVAVTINGRSYPVACGAGQEQRILELAALVESKVAGFARQFPQAGEARLLVLAALVIADELGDANEAVRRLKAQIPAAANDRRLGFREETLLADGIERLADRIEAVAARLEVAQL